jgi:TadE-like protein
MNRHRGRGQALAEFALVLPLLVLMIVAIFDLGRAVFAQNQLQNLADQGARAGVVRLMPKCPGLGPEACAVKVAKGEQVGLDPTLDATATCMEPDLSAPRPACDLGSILVVQVSMTWTPMTPIVGNIIGPQPLTGRAAMPIE